MPDRVTKMVFNGVDIPVPPQRVVAAARRYTNHGGNGWGGYGYAATPFYNGFGYGWGYGDDGGTGWWDGWERDAQAGYVVIVPRSALLGAWWDGAGGWGDWWGYYGAGVCYVPDAVVNQIDARGPFGNLVLTDGITSIDFGPYTQSQRRVLCEVNGQRFWRIVFTREYAWYRPSMGGTLASWRELIGDDMYVADPAREYADFWRQSTRVPAPRQNRPHQPVDTYNYWQEWLTGLHLSLPLERIGSPQRPLKQYAFRRAPFLSPLDVPPFKRVPRPGDVRPPEIPFRPPANRLNEPAAEVFTGLYAFDHQAEKYEQRRASGAVLSARRISERLPDVIRYRVNWRQTVPAQTLPPARVIDVPVASLSIPEFAERKPSGLNHQYWSGWYAGYSEDVRIFEVNVSMVVGTDPLPAVRRSAFDYYRIVAHRGRPQASYSGLVPWSPTGIESSVVWSCSGPDCDPALTHVHGSRLPIYRHRGLQNPRKFATLGAARQSRSACGGPYVARPAYPPPGRNAVYRLQRVDEGNPSDFWDWGGEPVDLPDGDYVVHRPYEPTTGNPPWTEYTPASIEVKVRGGRVLPGSGIHLDGEELMIDPRSTPPNLLTVPEGKAYVLFTLPDLGPCVLAPAPMSLVTIGPFPDFDPDSEVQS
jgi:hypothetical protein